MRSILVIEDDPNVRDNVLDMLQGEGFFVTAAENGEVGVAKALRHPPDLILCDIMMPGIDGFEVLRQVRRAPATSATPFIFLTARAARADMREGMDLGADDYLVKPFTADELLGAVQARLAKYEEQGHWYQRHLDQLRSNLSRNLPHELRTPLSSILGYSQFMLEIYDSVEPAELRDMLEEIYAAGRRLERLIENYHLYAQLELAASDPTRRTSLFTIGTTRPEQVLPPIVQAQADLFERTADLYLDLQPALVRMQSVYLEKLAEELVRNAIKFSKLGDPVYVGGRLTEDGYVLEVTDKGRGLTPEQIEQIGAFVQFGREKYEQQGLGLGLVLVQRILQLHQGTLHLESKSDVGLTAVATLRTAS